MPGPVCPTSIRSRPPRCTGDRIQWARDRIPDVEYRRWQPWRRRTKGLTPGRFQYRHLFVHLVEPRTDRAGDTFVIEVILAIALKGIAPVVELVKDLIDVPEPVLTLEHICVYGAGDIPVLARDVLKEFARPGNGLRILMQPLFIAPDMLK